MVPSGGRGEREEERGRRREGGRGEEERRRRMRERKRREGGRGKKELINETEKGMRKRVRKIQRRGDMGRERERRGRRKRKKERETGKDRKGEGKRNMGGGVGGEKQLGGLRVILKSCIWEQYAFTESSLLKSSAGVRDFFDPEKLNKDHELAKHILTGYMRLRRIKNFQSQVQNSTQRAN